MKTILSFALALRREIRDRDEKQFAHLLDMVGLVLIVPTVAIMEAWGHSADAGYWLLAGAFTLLVTLFVAGVVIQHVRASRAGR